MPSIERIKFGDDRKSILLQTYTQSWIQQIQTSCDDEEKKSCVFFLVEEIYIETQLEAFS